MPTMQVTVELPDEIAQQVGNKAEVSRRMLESFALEGYRAGNVSRGEVSQMLHLSFEETEAFLKRHEASLRYSLADLTADRAALKQILGGK